MMTTTTYHDVNKGLQPSLNLYYMLVNKGLQPSLNSYYMLVNKGLQPSLNSYYMARLLQIYREYLEEEVHKTGMARAAVCLCF